MTTPRTIEPDPTFGSLVGQSLGGRYEARSLIGAGGMGEVYEAVDALLGRRVAVKVLHAELASHLGYLARFRREARVVASLSHPNVVAVHDVGIHGRRPFIVMEMLTGRTLASLVRAEAPIDAARVGGIGRQIARALALAHARGVVHRDVSPGNVIVLASGDVKVLDFGIARAAGPAHSSQPRSTAHGTALYLSPEQARGEEADERSDVYSLGAVLDEMLTGRPPFRGETPEAVVARHLHETPTAPSRRVKGVPALLDEIVLRCLEKRPEDRYQLAWDVALDLGRVADPRPGGGSRPPSETSATARTRPLVPSPLTRRDPATRPLPARRQQPLPATRVRSRDWGRWTLKAAIAAIVLSTLARWLLH